MVLSIAKKLTGMLLGGKKNAPKAEAEETAKPQAAPTKSRGTQKAKASPPSKKIGQEPTQPRRRRRHSGGAAESAGEKPPARKPIKPWRAEDYVVPPEEGKTRFHDMDLPEPILHAIADAEFRYCTPIQAELLPTALKGSDVAGRAQTGTGKTAAFLITAFVHMLRNPPEKERPNGTPRALVLAPTRELVMQIARDAEVIAKHTGLVTQAVFGGMDYTKQRDRLRENPIDLVVATPGRLIDFTNRRDMSLRHVEVLVIDEADRMLDMGFIPDVRKIVHHTPPKTHRQTMLLSATLTPDVMRLAQQWTREMVVVEIEPEQVAVSTVEQVVYIVETSQKLTMTVNLLRQFGGQTTLIFVNRRIEAQRLSETLTRYDIENAVLSGDVPQQKRMRILEAFRAGEIRTVIATDVAGRGLHVEGIEHVINYNLPQDPEDYVHRIGRTGRAGALGTAYCFATEDEAFEIPSIEKYLGHDLPCRHPDDELLADIGRGKPAPRHHRQERGSRPPQGRRSGPRGPRRPRR